MKKGLLVFWLVAKSNHGFDGLARRATPEGNGDEFISKTF